MSYIPRLNINHASVSASSEETETTIYNMLKITYGVNATDLLATVSTEDGPIWEHAIEARAVEAGTEVMPWRRRVATRIGTKRGIVLGTSWLSIPHHTSVTQPYIISEAFAATVNFAAGYRIYEDGSLVTQPYLMGLDIAKYLFHYENLQSDWPLAHRNDMYPKPLYSDVDTVHSRAFDNAWGDQALTVRYETAPGVLVHTRGLQRRDRILDSSMGVISLYNTSEVSSYILGHTAPSYLEKDIPGTDLRKTIYSPSEISLDSSVLVPHYLGYSAVAGNQEDLYLCDLALGNLSGIPETSKGLKHIPESGYVLDANLRRTYYSPMESQKVVEVSTTWGMGLDYTMSPDPHKTQFVMETSNIVSRRAINATNAYTLHRISNTVECNDIGDPQIPEIYYQGSWQSLINDDKLAKQGSLEGNNEADLQRWESDLDIIEGLMARNDVDFMHLFVRSNSSSKIREPTALEEEVYQTVTKPMLAYHKQWQNSGLTFMSPTYTSLKELTDQLQNLLSNARIAQKYIGVYRDVTSNVLISQPNDPYYDDLFRKVQLIINAAKALTKTDEEWQLVKNILNIYAGTAVHLGLIDLSPISDYTWAKYSYLEQGSVSLILPTLDSLARIVFYFPRTSLGREQYAHLVRTKTEIDIGLQRKWIELERLVRPKQVTTRELELQRREAMITELKSALDGTWTPPADFVLPSVEGDEVLYIGDTPIYARDVTLEMYEGTLTNGYQLWYRFAGSTPTAYIASMYFGVRSLDLLKGYPADDLSWEYANTNRSGFWKGTKSSYRWQSDLLEGQLAELHRLVYSYYLACKNTPGYLTDSGDFKEGDNPLRDLTTPILLEVKEVFSNAIYLKIVELCEKYHRWYFYRGVLRESEIDATWSFSLNYYDTRYDTAFLVKDNTEYIGNLQAEILRLSLEPMQMLIDLERQLTLEEYGASGIQTDGRVSFEDLAKYRNVAYVMAPEGATLSTTGPVISVEVLDKS